MNYFFLFLFYIIIFNSYVFSVVCEYKYEPKKTILKWKAFKFSNRVGIEGTFDKIVVTQSKPAYSIQEFSDSVKFKIEVQSLNTNNIERDQKIMNIFFGSLIETKEIVGEFKNIKMNGDSGKGELILKINKKELPVPIIFKVRDEKEIELRGNLDLNNWNANKALEILNKECTSYHKGKDGKSKLWSDIEFYLISEINLICR